MHYAIGFFYYKKEKGDEMDARLQTIIDEARLKFGLHNYQLGTSEIYKERDAKGKFFYNFTMEWYPLESVELLEEDLNPDGTAIIDYHIQKEQFVSVTFVQGKSFSTVTQFPNKTVDEVAAWLEQETALRFGHDFKLAEERTNDFRFGTDIDDIRLSPNYMIEVKIDDDGKLINYQTYGLNPAEEKVEKSSFTLTLEEIEPLVKNQLQLVYYPSEEENRFKPIYAMEEVFVSVEDARVIPFMEEERTQVTIDEVIAWDEPHIEEFKREELSVLTIASAEEAFGHVGVEEVLKLTDEQIEQSKIAVRNAFSTMHPEETGLWQLEHLRYEQALFIEAHCKRNDDESAPFKRKVVVFIDPVDMSVMNFIDNEALFEIIETFDRAEQVMVTHEEAFEKLISYIGLDPTYVYDIETGMYILCGLLDAGEGVDAVTGEIVPLAEF